MSTHPVYLISAGELRRTQSAQVLAQTFKLTAEHFMNTHAFLTLHADATTWDLIAFFVYYVTLADVFFSKFISRK